MKEFNIGPDERIIFKLRKHWFVLLRFKAGVFVMGILPPIIFGFLASTKILPDFLLAPAVATFIVTFWLIVATMALAAVWTDYFLDVWIVTDKRIVNINQIGFFNREITTTRMERIQDATTKQRGLLETLLNFGSIRIQTASEDASDTLIEGIPHPTDVRRAIMDRIDTYTERHISGSRMDDENVSHATHTE